MTNTDRRLGVYGAAAFKVPVRVATTANITLSGLQTVDGVTVVADDRVLVKNQTTGTENGIYNASTGSWRRAKDFNGPHDVVKGTQVAVTSGSANSGAIYRITTADPIVIGTTSLAFGSVVYTNSAPFGTDYAVAVSNQGVTVTEAIVSTQCYAIKDVFNSGGSIAIRLMTQPISTPTSLVVRIDGGFHGTTRRAHPAQQTAAWTVTAGSDPFTFVLSGSTWVSGSVFCGGHCYVPDTTIDAAEKLNAMLAAARGRGPTKVYLPAGALVLKTAAIRVPESVTLIGQGGYNTFLCVPDQSFQLGADPFSSTSGSSTVTATVSGHGQSTGATFRLVQAATGNNLTVTGGSANHTITVVDANTFTFAASGTANATGAFGGSGVQLSFTTTNHALTSGSSSGTVYPNAGNIRVEGFAIYGNRGYQRYRAGLHAVDWGGDSNIDTYLTLLTMKDVHVIGSAGYGMSFGGNNTKTHLKVKDCSFWFSDSDNMDCKNRTPYESQAVDVDGCSFKWHAMGDTGTDLKPQHAIANNGITTTNGSTLCSIAPASTDIGDNRAGDKITISGASTFNGVAPNGTWQVTTANETIITFDTAQTANASGTGGGSAGLYYEPNISVGDVALDVRGSRYSVSNCLWEGENWSRNVFRQRGDSIFSPYATFHNLRGEDLTPAAISAYATGRSFLSILGYDTVATQIVFETSGGSLGIEIGNTARRANLSGFNITGATVALKISGLNSKASNGQIKNPSQRGVVVTGSTSETVQELGDDPFTAISVGVSTVEAAAYAHGRSVDDVVTFERSISGNGLTIVRGTEYTITAVPSADAFRFVASGTSTATTAFGGELVTVAYVGTTQAADDTDLMNVTVMHDGANSAVGYSIGYDGSTKGNVTDTTINLCRSSGVTTHKEDYATDTKWGIGNTNLPNNAEADTLDVDTMDSGAWGDPVATWTYSTAVTNVEFTTLGKYREIRIVMLAMTHNNNNSQNWGVQVSARNGLATGWLDDNGGYTRIGDSLGTNRLLWSGSLAAATAASGQVIIHNFNQPHRSFAKVHGGQNGGSSVISAGGFINAPLASFSVTAGTVSAGVNEITDITVGGTSIITADVDIQAGATQSDRNTATASAIATEINSTSSVYEAVSDGAVVTVYEIGGDGSSNGLTLAVAVAGDAAVSVTNPTMLGAFNVIRILPGAASISGGSIYVYGKQ